MKAPDLIAWHLFQEVVRGVRGKFTEAEGNRLRGVIADAIRAERAGDGGRVVCEKRVDDFGGHLEIECDGKWYQDNLKTGEELVIRRARK